MTKQERFFFGRLKFYLDKVAVSHFRSDLFLLADAS